MSNVPYTPRESGTEGTRERGTSAPTPAPTPTPPSAASPSLREPTVEGSREGQQGAPRAAAPTAAPSGGLRETTVEGAREGEEGIPRGQAPAAPAVDPRVANNLVAGDQVASSFVGPDGTTLWVTAKGYVYAPDGGYYGSYMDDNVPGMAGARNDPNRTFVGGQATANGYVLIGSQGERYNFYNDFGRLQNTAAAAANPVAGQAAQNGGFANQQQRDAWAFSQTELDKWGLGGLGPTVKDLIINGAGDEEVKRVIRESPTYKTRFAGMEARRKAGYSAMSEAEYLQSEDTFRSIMKSYGLPAGLYDSPDDFTNYIGGNISAQEFTDRVAGGYQWAKEADPYLKAQMQNLYGMTDGDMAALALDPDKAMPFFEHRKTAIEIAAQGARTGWGQLTTAQAEALQQQGVTEQAAGQGFANLANLDPLFDQAINETGGDFSTDQQLGIAFGNDTQQQQRLSRRSRARQNSALAGGGATQTQRGTSLGTVS